jgi:hypothetical protein
LLEGGAADGEVGLDAVGGAGLQVEGGILAEEVDGRVGDEGLVAGGDDLDGAIALGEGEGFEGGGDGDALVDGCDGAGGLRLLGVGRDTAKKESESRELVFHSGLRVLREFMMRCCECGEELILSCYK